MSKILITIPVWNEALIIERSLRALQRACADLLKDHDVVIEVVDNASTDDTRSIIEGCGKTAEKQGDGSVAIRALAIPEKGKGLAVRTSWQNNERNFDAFAFLDADMSADLRALPALIDPILDGRADMVCGSRFKKGSRVKRSMARTAGSYAYRMLQQTILHLPVRDAQCGFKAASPNLVRSVLPSCNESGWLFDTELILRASKNGFRMLEIPISWIENRMPERRSAFYVFKDGREALRTIVRLRRRILD